MVRAGWYEYTRGQLDLETLDKCIREIRGVCVLDAKSLFDTFKNRTPANQLEEKRGALELLRMYQHFVNDNIEIRWVHSEANLADCMTKIGAHGIWEAFMKECKRSIVQDS